MNALRPITQAELNAANNARCAPDWDWERLAHEANEAAGTLKTLWGEWRQRYIERDTPEPDSKLIHMVFRMKELVDAIDAMESGE